MKYMFRIGLFLVLALLSVLASCENGGPECFRNAGSTVRYELPADAFTAIHISQGIALVIRQGEIQKIEVATGENLTEYITAEVTGTELFVTNSNNCNWVRDYNSTTVYITTPVLEKVYSGSQFAVRSDGVLSFPTLNLQSGLFSETASGTFEVELNSEALVIEDNQSAYYVITGSVTNVSVNFYSGDARFDGSNLEVQTMEIFHRSSNDIIAKPVQKISGTLYSTGNLVLKNQPAEVEVEQLYSGRVIYN